MTQRAIRLLILAAALYLVAVMTAGIAVRVAP